MPTNSFPLVFTTEQLAVIDQTLQAAPYRVAAPLIAEINRQLQALQQPAIPAETSAKAVALVGGDPYPEVKLA